MGHNFGQVGEEYDGGGVYRGANSAVSAQDTTWSHWLTDRKAKVEESILLVQKYPWFNLSNGPYSITFTSTGTYPRWYLHLSVSNMQHEDDFQIQVDGMSLMWKWNGLKDRSMYSWTESSMFSFTKGTHTLTMITPGSTPAAVRQICSLTLHEYKSEESFQMKNDKVISIYPTWNAKNVKSYRPSNEKCLMRNMTSTSFCTVCEEVSDKNIYKKY